jgi:hypothetical protein
MKLFNFDKWINYYVDDFIMNVTKNYFYILEIRYRAEFKVFIQIEPKKKLCRCFMTNGISYYKVSPCDYLQNGDEFINFLKEKNISLI